MAATLLIGNDVNNIAEGYSWTKLLKELVHFVGAVDSLKPVAAQFPLFYEAIVAFGAVHNTKSEAEIKQFIADKVQRLAPNKIHRELVGLGSRDLLTTNYDFTIESVFERDGPGNTNEDAPAERRYSLFRCYRNDKVRTWHIHGDAAHPATIALGYEHYSGYLQTMRNYVVAGTRRSYKGFSLPPLTKRLKEGGVETASWVDLFFTHDVHILGLRLDFVEIHLWWLLTYRARFHNLKSGKLKNKVVYYYPRGREKDDADKLRLLAANGVQIKACGIADDRDKGRYYNAVLDELDRAIHRRR